MITIKKVTPHSLASKSGLKEGMKILSINKHPVNNIIDLEFYAASENLYISAKDNSRGKEYFIKRNYTEPLGIEVEKISPKICNNRCIFCFYDQLPTNLRKSLYVKDDDYRLSFLFGNFITLTNLKKEDFNDIFEKRLSPLYISVHTTNPDLRVKMMKNPKAADIMKYLKFLAQNDIYMHTQIVLCPEINDGKHLAKTIEDLEKFYPYIKSIGVVPVGLTKYRDTLPFIKSPTQEWAKDIINDFDSLNEKFRNKIGSGFVYLSDEFFLLAHQEIPDTEYYDDFPQLENGIGMSRLFLNDLMSLDIKSKGGKTILITGKLAFPILEKLAVKLKKNKWDIELIPIENELFGHSVTVSGLLSGMDIKNGLKGTEAEKIILPPDVVNEDAVFLDNTELNKLQNEIGAKIIIAPYRLKNLPEVL